MTQENVATFADANGNAKPVTPLEQFAAAHRLKVRRDECGDEIILGRFGHLYFDGPRLCLMRLDAPSVRRSRLTDLVGPDGEVWAGDISPDCQGRRVQDIEVKGIRPDAYRLAIRLAGVKAKRVLSEAQRLHAEKALRKARAARIAETSPGTASPAPERDEGAAGDV